MMKIIIYVALLFFCSIDCYEAHASSPKESIRINESAVAGLGRFLSAQYKDRALTEDEIKKEIGPVFDRNEDKIYGLPAVVDSCKDEAALRLLLDVIYYQQKYARVLNAELAESLNEGMETFFEGKSSKVFENVLKDKKQLNREAIVYNFDRYIGMDLPEDGKLPPHLEELRRIIDKYAEYSEVRTGGKSKKKMKKILWK